MRARPLPVSVAIVLLTLLSLGNLACVLSTRSFAMGLCPSQNSLSRCLREGLGGLLDGRVALGSAREAPFGPSR